MKQIIVGSDDVVGAWVLEQQDSAWTPNRGTTLGLAEDGKLIAGVVFDSWNGASLCMHVAAVPGSRWMTKEFLRLCFAYPFQQMGCTKLIGLVGSKNLAARKFDEHLGFVLEATLNEAHPDGQLLVYTMTKAQCRWLSRNYLKERRNGQTFRTGTD